VNREMRRIQQKDEERARRRRKAAPQQRGRDRVGFRQFFREVRQELKKVAWPTRDETATYTVVVVVVTTILTGVTFGLDYFFRSGMLRILGAS